MLCFIRRAFLSPDHAKTREQITIPYRSQACRRFHVLILSGLLLVASSLGCGGGGSSGGGSSGGGSGSSVQDFTISLSPSSLALPTAGISAPFTVSTSVSGNAGDAETISFALPNGIHCVSQCQTAIDSGQDNAIKQSFSADPNLPPASYAVQITVSNATYSHSVTATLQVYSAVLRQNDGTDYVFTGDPQPRALSYDSQRHLVYASNLQLNEIDIISENTAQIVKRIPVPQPYGTDISVDGSLLYVGTLTQFLYTVDLNQELIIDKVPIPLPLPFVQTFRVTADPLFVAALSTGDVLVAMGNPVYMVLGTPTSGPLALNLYHPPTRTFTDLTGLLHGFLSVQVLSSGDHKHALVFDKAGGYFAIYDAVSGQFSSTGSNETISATSISADGSLIALQSSCCGFNIYDGSARLLQTDNYSRSNEIITGLAFSPDGKTLYIAESYFGDNVTGPNSPALTSYVRILDSTSLNELGRVPTIRLAGGVIIELSGHDPNPVAVDSQGRLIGLAERGISFLDVSAPVQNLHNDSQPVLSFPYVLQPDHPENSSTATTLNAETQFYSFTDPPSVYFAGQPANNVQVQSPGTIGLAAPTGSGQVNVKAYYSDGYMTLAPLAYSYRPLVEFGMETGGTTSGGSTLRLAALGLPANNADIQVTIGGHPASVTSVSAFDTSTVFDTYTIPLKFVNVTAPAGALGVQPVTITTPNGTTALPGGFLYASEDDFTVTGTPWELIYDDSRDRLYYILPDTNQLVAYSVAKGQVDVVITTGNQPQGIAITPDNSKILVVAQDGSFAVYDADSLAQIHTQVISPAQTSPNPPLPKEVAALAGNQALIGFTSSSGSLAPEPLVAVDLNTYATKSAASTGNVAFTYNDQSNLAASADGTRAFAGNGVWNSLTDSFAATVAALPMSPRALSDDGSVMLNDLRVVDANGNLQVLNLTAEDVNAGYACSYCWGEKLHSSGGLAYILGASGIYIFDTHYGRLLGSLGVPQGIKTRDANGYLISRNPFAVNNDGDKMYFVTQNGISVMSLAKAPLSIGTATVNGPSLLLHGSGFLANAVVKVDGQAVTSTFVDVNNLQVSLPSLSAGLHEVQVALSNGESYTYAAAFATP